MRPVSTITPGVLAAIAADWTETELRAAAAVLTDLLRDRGGDVPVGKPKGADTADRWWGSEMAD